MRKSGAEFIDKFPKLILHQIACIGALDASYQRAVDVS